MRAKFAILSFLIFLNGCATFSDIRVSGRAFNVGEVIVESVDYNPVSGDGLVANTEGVEIIEIRVRVTSHLNELRIFPRPALDETGAFKYSPLALVTSPVPRVQTLSVMFDGTRLATTNAPTIVPPQSHNLYKVQLSVPRDDREIHLKLHHYRPSFKDKSLNESFNESFSLVVQDVKIIRGKIPVIPAVTVGGLLAVLFQIIMID